jgi:uncharacterized protein with HEPN domain
MLECIERVKTYTSDGESVFLQSQLVQDAVIRNLQVMAESSQRLSESTKLIAPDVPWRSISGFRNIMVHDYLGLDLEVIWSVVSQELPNLEMALSKIKELKDCYVSCMKGGLRVGQSVVVKTIPMRFSNAC